MRAGRFGPVRAAISDYRTKEHLLDLFDCGTLYASKERISSEQLQDLSDGP